MKTVYPIFMLFMFALLLSACSPALVTTKPTIEINITPSATLAPTQSNTATLPPAPTALPTPTETPAPIPCTIAFESNRDGNFEIYLMNSDGSNPVNLTNFPGDDMQPAISADGRRIAFISNRENDNCSGESLFVMNSDGSNLNQLTNCNWPNFPDWAENGEWIAFSADGDIFIVKSDGSQEPINLTNSPEEDMSPVISPDNQNIAFLSGGSHNWTVFIMNFDGSNITQLTTDPGEIGIDWAEDGRIVVVGWGRGDQGCCNFVMNPDGSEITLAGGKGEMQKYLPFWTLDGNRVECVGLDLNGNSEIYLVGEIYPDVFLNLTNNPAFDSNPSWPAQCGPGNTEQSGPEVQVTDEENDEPSSYAPGEIVLGYAGDNPWQSQRKENFFKACQELGIECVQDEFDSLVNQKVSAIVLNSRNEAINGYHPSILAARDQGIPVVVLDAENITDGAFYITIDHQEWASKSLEWMFEEMGRKGDFAFFNFQTDNNFKRVIGDFLDKYPDIELVESRFEDYSHDHLVMEADVRSFAKKYPNMKGVWADEEFANVIWGLKGAVPPNEWPSVLCEASKKGLQVWETVLKDQPGFDCIALSNPPGIAYEAAYTAYYLARGMEINPDALSGEFGKTLYVDFPIITSENLSEWVQKIANENDDYQIDQFMTPEEILETWFLP